MFYCDFYRLWIKAMNHHIESNYTEHINKSGRQRIERIELLQKVSSKAIKSVKNWKILEGGRNILSKRKNNSVWARRTKYSLENLKRDWYPVGTRMGRKALQRQSRDVWKENWVVGKPRGKMYRCEKKKKSLAIADKGMKKKERLKYHYFDQPTYLWLHVWECGHERW